MSWMGVKLTLKSYLGFNLFYVAIIAVCLTGVFHCLCIKKKKADISVVGEMVFSSYLAFLFGGTLLNREREVAYGIKFTPFWSYVTYFQNKNPALLLQMVYNLLIFIPFPFFLRKMLRKTVDAWKVVGAACLLSSFIEIMQWVLKLGLCEFDDVFHNTVGALFGCVLYKLFFKKSITEYNI